MSGTKQTQNPTTQQKENTHETQRVHRRRNRHRLRHRASRLEAPARRHPGDPPRGHHEGPLVDPSHDHRESEEEPGALQAGRRRQVRAPSVEGDRRDEHGAHHRRARLLPRRLRQVHRRVRRRRRQGRRREVRREAEGRRGEEDRRRARPRGAHRVRPGRRRRSGPRVTEQSSPAGCKPGRGTHFRLKK